MLCDSTASGGASGANTGRGLGMMGAWERADGMILYEHRFRLRADEIVRAARFRNSLALGGARLHSGLPTHCLIGGKRPELLGMIAPLRVRAQA